MVPDLDDLLHTFCHHQPDRLLEMFGNSSVLCARCSGIYLSILLGLAFVALFARVHNYRAGASAFIVTGLFVVIMPIEVLFEIATPFEGTNLLRYATGVLFGSGFSMLLGTFWSVFFPSESLPKAGTAWFVGAGQFAVASVTFVLSLLLWQWAIFNILVFAGLASAYFVVNIILARALIGIRPLFACVLCSVVLTALEWYLLYQANSFAL